MSTTIPLDPVGLFNAVTSHAASLGLFETVTGHEAVSAPGNGVHYEVYAGPIMPARGSSGLDTTSIVVTILGRVKISSTREPLDQVETDMLYATGQLMASYTGNFQLGLPGIREIDLLGEFSGAPLSARPGYVVQDGQQFRITDITIPVVLNDVWQQIP